MDTTRSNGVGDLGAAFTGSRDWGPEEQPFDFAGRTSHGAGLCGGVGVGRGGGGWLASESSTTNRGQSTPSWPGYFLDSDLPIQHLQPFDSWQSLPSTVFGICMAAQRAHRYDWQT